VRRFLAHCGANEKTLIEMKLSSVGERTDDFKKSKDVADLFMLLYNEPELLTSADGKLRREFKTKLNDLKTRGNIADAASMLGVPVNVVLRTLEKI
jgi:hypothetical protein